ncbi:phosphoserine phosphatase SerB [Stakelama saccharophila]|uniref:Phosphoserine phosphatase n=1 Tax=Stakelama saccharophila TaxID=3075605 RepID=A0ABZ0B5V7_9SPHN|nr:phosphoserine phosphatase SerB [Stakelama sp. W311]WNO52638.1 phosphoserine phosphatase SerB [Stakelama sp. W311]
MFIATLIASDMLAAGDISSARDRLADAGCAPSEGGWIDAGRAADIPFAMGSERARAALEGAFAGVDLVVQPAEGRRKRLLIADMDSTMITVECIDELADYAGIKAEIAAVTEQAMRGELDFAEALDARVALLKGLEATAIEQCLAERVMITPGARQLVRTMRAGGAMTVLVSGGFTHFAGPVGREIGFERVVANDLLIDGAALTGAVGKPIVDSSTKERTLEEELTRLDLPADAALAVGDGANDLAMIGKAGLGVAYHAKPVVAAAARARIDHGDLSALLYAQGIPRARWITD